MEILNRYLYWQKEKRIKMSLGAKNPLEFRNRLNLTAQQSPKMSAPPKAVIISMKVFLLFFLS